MAQQIVAKSTSKLNLFRRHVALFQKIILVGGKMAKAINSSEAPVLPKEASKYAREWSHLMVKLAKTLL